MDVISADDPCAVVNDCDNDALATCMPNGADYMCFCKDVHGHNTVWNDTTKMCEFPNGGM